MEHQPYYAQLKGQREDRIGRGLWPQMLRRLMETPRVADCFKEGDPCPYMWIEDCVPLPNYDFSDFNQLLPKGGVSRLPCGGEMASIDFFLNRHRCTKELLAISEEREAGRALACIACGLRYVHPLMA